jgi:hypothetical protein
MAMSRPGMANSTSSRRVIKNATQPPRQAETRASGMPSSSDSSTIAAGPSRLVLAPKINREAMSRPVASVPSQ